MDRRIYTALAAAALALAFYGWYESDMHFDPGLGREQPGYTLFVIEYDGPGELPVGEIMGILESLAWTDAPLDYRLFHPEILTLKRADWSEYFSIKNDAHILMVPGLWDDDPVKLVPFRAVVPYPAGGLLVWKDGPAEAALKEIPGILDVSLIETHFAGEPGRGQERYTYDYVLFVMQYGGEPGRFPSEEIHDAIGKYTTGWAANSWITHPDRDMEYPGAGKAGLVDGAHILVVEDMLKHEVGDARAMLEDMPEIAGISHVGVSDTRESWTGVLEGHTAGTTTWLDIQYGGNPDDFPLREIMKNTDRVMERRGEFHYFNYALYYPNPGYWDLGNDTYHYIFDIHGDYRGAEVDEILNIPGIQGHRNDRVLDDVRVDLSVDDEG